VGYSSPLFIAIDTAVVNPVAFTQPNSDAIGEYNPKLEHGINNNGAVLISSLINRATYGLPK